MKEFVGAGGEGVKKGGWMGYGGGELGEKILSASIGALITCVAVTPLDVVKVRMQSAVIPSATVSSPVSYVFCTRFYDHVEPCQCRTLYIFDRPIDSRMPRIRGTIDGIMKVSRYEGITALWRGLCPTLLMAVPATVVYLVGYEAIKDSLLQRNQYYNSIALSPQQTSFMIPLVAGSTARILAVSLISPLELLKTKMQYKVGNEGRVGTVVKELWQTVKSIGPLTLYKGLIPTLWRDVPFSALYWAGFEKFRDYYKEVLFRKPTSNGSGSSHFLLSFMAGASSGMIAAALTTPFDVAKTRQQVETPSSLSVRRKGIIRNLREIWQSEGLAGLTRGIIPRICKVAPSCAIMVGSYEFGKHYLSSHR